MERFNGNKLYEFNSEFETDLDCKKYLSELKWENGYKCKKCSHTKSQTRIDFSKTCNKCSHTESVTANTLFHRTKFGLRKAFFICFKMCLTSNTVSASQISIRYDIQINTARLFMNKVRNAMNSSQKNIIINKIKENIDTINNYQKTNEETVTICARITDKKTIETKIAIFRIKKTEEKTIKNIFEKQEIINEIDCSIYLVDNIEKKDFCVKPILQKKQSYQKEVEKNIQEAKIWIKKTYVNINEENIYMYLDEYCYLINEKKEEKFRDIIINMIMSEN